MPITLSMARRCAGRPVPSLWWDEPELLNSEALFWAALATQEERQAYATACFIEMTAQERRHVSAMIRKAVRG